MSKHETPRRVRLSLESLEARHLLAAPLLVDLGASTDADGVIQVSGNAGGDQLGFDVSDAGDVNGDGLADVLISARWADPAGMSAAGETYLLFGRTSGWGDIDLSAGLDASVGIKITGANPGDQSGYSVASAGDVNNDGYDDILIGAPGADPDGRANAGASYLLFGHAGAWADIDLSNPGDENVVVILGGVVEDVSGWSVGPAGDVNGDGYDDFLIGAHSADPGGRSFAGEAILIFGHGGTWTDVDLSAPLAPSTGIRIMGDDDGDQAGVAVNTAGDINGDGYDDMLVGAPFADPAGGNAAGETYVVFGHAGAWADIDLNETLPAGTVVRVFGDAIGDENGYAVAPAGDVNGDGYADFLIGAPYADPPGGSAAGEAYLVFGHAGTWSDIDLNGAVSAAKAVRIKGDNSVDYLGRSVASAGDVNLDGYDDILIGADASDPLGRAQAGDVTLILGRPDGWTDIDLNAASPDAFRLAGGTAGEHAGWAVSRVGDMNGDGIDEVVVGAPYAAPGSRYNAGAAYIVFSTPRVGDRVWFDTNENGLQDAGEAGAEGVTVRLLDGDLNPVATTTTDADGQYRFLALGPADYAVEVVAPDGYRFGTQGAGSDAALDSDVDATTGRTGVFALAAGELRDDLDAALIADAATPVVSIAIQSASDTGLSDSDGNTSDTTPTYDVAVNGPGLVEIDWDGDGTYDTSDAQAEAGTFAYTADPFADGEYTVTVRFTNAVGVSATDSTLTVIDTLAPSVPAAPDLQSSSDTGVSDSDNLTRVTTPAFDVPATDAWFHLYVNGTAVANYATGGTYELVDALADGPHVVTSRSVDRAGNASGVSPGVTVTIDTTAPDRPAAPDLQPGSDSGISNTDDLTRVTTPSFDVPATDAYFDLYVNGSQVVASAPAGAHTLADALSDGLHTVQSRSVDAAGNASALSEALEITVDTQAPGAPGTPDLDDTSDPDRDDQTIDSTPTFNVIPPADAYFRMYRNGVATSGAPALGDDGTIYRSGTQEELPSQPYGTHHYTATAIDAAGNESAPSSPLAVRVVPLTLIDSHRYDDGVRVSVYDVDPADGISAPDIAWDPTGYQRGQTDVLIMPGAIGDGMIDLIYLLGDGGGTEDLGIVVERDGGGSRYLVHRFVDVRRGGGPLGLLAVVGGDLAVGNFSNGLSGGNLNGFLTPGGYRFAADVDGDGDSSDTTALFVSRDTLTVLIRGPQSGDVVVGGNARTVVNYGQQRGDVRVAGDLGVFQAINHGGVGIDGDVSVGGHAGRIFSFGDVNGNVTAGGLDVLYTAGAFRGGLDVNGHLGTALFYGDVGGAVDVTGDARTMLVVGGRVTNDVTIGGGLHVFKVVGYRGGAGVVMDGDLSVGGSATLIFVHGGDTDADITVQNHLTSLILYGNFTGRVRTVAGSAGSVLVVGGSLNGRGGAAVVDIAGDLAVFKATGTGGGNVVQGDVAVGGRLNVFYAVGGDVDGALTAGAINVACYFGPGGVTGPVTTTAGGLRLLRSVGPIAGDVDVAGRADTIQGLRGISGNLRIGNGAGTVYSHGAFTGTVTVDRGDLSRLTIVNRGAPAMNGASVNVANGGLDALVVIGDYHESTVEARRLSTVRVAGALYGTGGDDFIRATDASGTFRYWHNALFHTVTKDAPVNDNGVVAGVGPA